MNKKKVMLLTGTSRGIGSYLAQYFSEQGWMVIGSSRSKSDFQSNNYRHFEVDLTKEDQVVSWIRSVMKDYGRIDAAINNAGIARMNHALLTPAKMVDRIIAVNLRATILVCREVGKVMQRKKYGRIINFSSVAVSLSLEGESVYVASKSAVEAYSRVLARELAGWNITVNVVAPPPVKTDMIKGIPEDVMKNLIDRMVIPRYGKFSDIANVLDFFLSPKSSMITGQIITIGGW